MLVGFNSVEVKLWDSAASNNWMQRTALLCRRWSASLKLPVRRSDYPASTSV
jgi:hypothetical protein